MLREEIEKIIHNAMINEQFQYNDYVLIVKELEALFASHLQLRVEEAKQRRCRVEGMTALITFIRNKARLDIMKADEYGQGYYQAIKDMENYFGISEVDVRATLQQKKDCICYCHVNLSTVNSKITCEHCQQKEGEVR